MKAALVNMVFLNTLVFVHIFAFFKQLKKLDSYKSYCSIQ